jgi:hypothetical protein
MGLIRYGEGAEQLIIQLSAFNQLQKSSACPGSIHRVDAKAASFKEENSKTDFVNV